MPFGKRKRSDRLLLNEKAKSLRYSLNSRGLKMLPWRTPLAYWKDRVFLLPRLTEHIEFAYKLFIRLKNFPPTLHCNSLYRSLSCLTESKAFLKSTKQAYTLVWWPWTYITIKFRNVRTWSAVRLLPKRSIWDLCRMTCRISSDLTWSRSLWFWIERIVFQKLV